MILIQRSPAPSVITNAKIQHIRDEITDYYKSDIQALNQRKFPFKMTYTALFLAELLRQFNNKCAYCESPANEDISIDHFRPYNGALDLFNTYSPHHYGWLMYDWNNLYTACRMCISNKRNYFPLEDNQRAPILGDVSVELPLFLDPCIDNPEKHLYFNPDGTIEPLSERGFITINGFGLNRSYLVDERKLVMHKFRAAWDMFLENRTQLPTSEPRSNLEQFLLDSLDQKKSPFIAFKREFVRAQLKVDGSVRKFLKDRPGWSVFYTVHIEHSEPKLDLSLPKIPHIRYWIKRIEVYNLRDLRHLDITVDVDGDDAPWLMLLGENATGKSTLLQAIALLFMDTKGRGRQKRKASSFLPSNESQGFVKVHLSNCTEPFVIEFSRDPDKFKITRPSDAKPLIIGYGSTRLLPKNRKEKPQDRMLDNLFNPFLALVDAEAWFSSLRPQQFDRAVATLKCLLPLEDENALFEIEDTGEVSQVYLKQYGRRISFNQLSDGYQTVIALACDIMMHLLKVWPDTSVAEGVVLLDELDVHLHPRWKMRIVDMLRDKRVFPKVQFIATTHEPLCLRGLHNREVTVLKRVSKQFGDGMVSSQVIALEQLKAPNTLQIDQILTSHYFGLHSTLTPEIDRLFDRYYELLSLREPNEEQKQEIIELQKTLEDHDLLGSTPREQMFYKLIDKHLARRRNNQLVESTLDDDLSDMLTDIWNSIDIGED